jgi:hypothetical protein
LRGDESRDQIDGEYREGVARHGEEMKRVLREGAACLAAGILKHLKHFERVAE